MGDYLKMMAGRVLGRASPAVHPRIPSLFEPPSLAFSARFMPFAGISSRAEPQPSVMTEVQVQRAQERMTDPQPLSPAARQARHEAPPNIEAEKHDPQDKVGTSHAPGNMKPGPGKHQIQPSVSRVEHRRAEREEPAATAPHTLEVKPQTDSLPLLEQLVRTDPEQPAHRVQPTQPKVRQEVQRKMAEPRVERELLKEVVGRVKQAQAVGAPARQPDAQVGPAQPSVRPQREAIPLDEPPEDTRPVINVVIGRVSVSAVTERPAAAARAARPQGPMLSLDRYLEQRGGRHE